MIFDSFFEAFQYQSYSLISFFSAQVSALPVSYAFGAGMLASVNPCGFIMLPAFAAYYFTSDNPEVEPTTLQRLAKALQMGALVSLAFVVTFGLAGVVITAGGRFILQGIGWAGLAIGAALIVLGLYQIATRRSVFAGATAGVRVRRSASMGGVLAFGVAYAVASLGCTLPIFMIVLGGIFVGDGTFLESVGSFAEYGIGMGVVLTVITLGIALFRQQTTRLVSGMIRYVEPVGNVLLVFAGAYLLWYWTTQGSILL